MRRPPRSLRAWHAGAAALLLMLAAGPVQSVLAQDEASFQLVNQDSRSTTINEMVDDQTFRELRRGVYWQALFGQSNTRYIRLRFDGIKSPPNAAYRVRVLKLPLEEEVASYTAAEFSRQESFMTGLLPPGELRVELLADSAPKGVSFRLERALWSGPPTQSSVHSPIVNTLLITFFPEGSAIRAPEHSVAALHIGPTETTCTGVLIDGWTVATNHHCMLYSLAFQQSKQTPAPSCQDVTVEFDFFAPNQRGPTAQCEAVKTDDKLDVALLRLDRDASELTPGKPREPVKLRPASEGMPDVVRMLHHPIGLPLAIHEHCRIFKVEQTDLFHDCAATNGSSGSPLFDEQMRWVGLHYKGAYPKEWSVEKQNADRLQNGPKFNQARAGAAVLEFLKKQVP